MESDARGWRPQAFGRKSARDVRNPLVEPGWDGLRVLVRVEPGKPAEITDVDGTDVGEACGPIPAAIVEAVMADGAVLDGYLTDQARRDRAVVIGEVGPTGSVGGQVAQFLLGGAAGVFRSDRASSRGPVRGTPAAARAATRGARPDPEADPLARLAFVAVDLLSVDDQSLLEVPLMERKRILESVIAESELVRLTPFVREPVNTFLESWQAAGFAELAYKDPNSRYLPGRQNEGWALAPMPRR
jgi:ATP-dependent DNA ligase